MRSSNSKMIGNGVTSTGTPVENGLLQKESLPTIQIDTVPSPVSSPTELSPVSAQSNEEPVDDSQIDIDIEDVQAPESLSDELRESLKSYIEDILSKAMVVADNKLKIDDFDNENTDEGKEEEDQTVPQHTSDSIQETPFSAEQDDEEIRAAAAKVVEEVLQKAQETVIAQIEQFEKEIASMSYPELPSIHVDTVTSVPPSPEMEEEPPRETKKWCFKMNSEDSDSIKIDVEEQGKSILYTFDEAPERVKEVASNFVKEILSKAIAQIEEKSGPTVPFTFDVDLMKTNGPWYVRVREAFIRVLRTACFCTPRRNDS